MLNSTKIVGTQHKASFLTHQAAHMQNRIPLSIDDRHQRLAQCQAFDITNRASQFIKTRTIGQKRLPATAMDAISGSQSHINGSQWCALAVTDDQGGLQFVSPIIRTIDLDALGFTGMPGVMKCRPIVHNQGKIPTMEW